MNDEGPFVIYRWFDASGRLIYLGMTNRPLDRPHEHVRTKPWVADCVTMTLEHLPPHWDRKRAKAYELRCIRQELPRENTAGLEHLRPRVRRAARRRRSHQKALRRLHSLQKRLVALALLLGLASALLAAAGLLGPLSRL